MIFHQEQKRIVKKGDILYSSVRPNLKGYVYISDDIQNGIASTGFADIRVKEPNTILSKYLYYIMTRDSISEYLISKSKGAQYPAVSFDEFETLQIPIPSLERQQEIVAYCEHNDALIKHLEMEIAQHKTQAQLFLNTIVHSSTTTSTLPSDLLPSVTDLLEPSDENDEIFHEEPTTTTDDSVGSLVSIFESSCVISDPPNDEPKETIKIPSDSVVGHLPMGVGLFAKWTKEQLKTKCQELGIKGVSSKPKQELMNRILAHPSMVGYVGGGGGGGEEV